jgi:hypothetical protein
MSARFRRGGAISGDDSTDFPTIAAFQHGKWVFDAMLASGEPPRSWRRWTLDFIRIEEELHRGTAGFIDSAYYAAAERYMRRHNAPADVVQTIRFLRGVAEWNYTEMAAAADALLAMRKPGSDILSADFLRDGGTIAKLRLGDAQGAKDLFDRLSSEPGMRPAGHFQTRLLEAHVLAAGSGNGTVARVPR